MRYSHAWVARWLRAVAGVLVVTPVLSAQEAPPYSQQDFPAEELASRRARVREAREAVSGWEAELAAAATGAARRCAAIATIREPAMKATTPLRRMSVQPSSIRC